MVVYTKEAIMSQEKEQEKVSFEAMAQQWQTAMVDTWSAMSKQFVGSEGFAAGSSAYMDWALAGQKQIRSNSAQFLDALEFPKRSDIARLAKQIAQVEARLAEAEESSDKVISMLTRLEKKMDALAASQAAPKTESVKVATPKVEAAKVEAPKVEAPKAEATKIEAPKAETVKVEAAKVEAPVKEVKEAAKAQPAAGGKDRSKKRGH
jgi:hypothetical protein